MIAGICGYVLYKTPNVRSVAILALFLQMGLTSNAFGFESYYRNDSFKMTTETSDIFYGKIKPILDRRCVACHSCRESACRLKLTSPEGILRGASSNPILGSSFFAVPRTKLFHDAFTEKKWRKLGFYSVLNTPKVTNKAPYLLLGPSDPLGRNSIFTAALANKYEDQTKMEKINLIGPKNQMCGNGKTDYNKVPGMPYKMAPLSPTEFSTLFNWAKSKEMFTLPSSRALLMLKTSQNPELIKRWENFFNHKTNKAKWTSRFLYEHLFLARFYFQESPGEFYELVRSKTAGPEPILVAPTLHAFEKPKVENFYYRLRKIHSTIVDKNHFVYEVNDKILEELKNMFWQKDWGKRNNYIKFNFDNSNPMVAFKHMSAKSRYRWMLKNAHLLLDISARSQNCRSEGAGAPYWDNMVQTFLKPESDPTVMFGKRFYDEVGKFLPIPNTTDGRKNIFKTFNKVQKKYAKIKNRYAQQLRPKGLTLNDIWRGENDNNKNAIVTVLRHQWTASAHKGQLGNMPRSMLLLDFASFERYFYLCNVATDISENLIGQSRVVRYLFDIKKEVENQFLSLVPGRFRNEIRSSLVEGLDQNKEFVNIFTRPYVKDNGYDYKNANTFSDIAKEFFSKTFNSEIIGKRSFIFKADVSNESILKSQLERLSEIKGSIGTHMPNVSYLRVRNINGAIDYYTITANRYFKSTNNFSFLDTDYEKKQRSPDRDTLEVFEGIMVNYPEKIYMIDYAQAGQYISDLKKINSRTSFLSFNYKYGLNQKSKQFWTIVDEMNSRYIGNNPVYGGIIDLHRYGSLDLVPPL